MLGYGGESYVKNGVIRHYVGGTRFSWVDCEDVAAVAAGCLLDPEDIRGKRIASDTKPGESSRYAERERTKANDMSKNKAKTVEEFDRRFDEGESIFELAEVTSVSRHNLEVQRVNVDFPKHFLQKLDREAELRGVSRQALMVPARQSISSKAANTTVSIRE